MDKTINSQNSTLNETAPISMNPMLVVQGQQFAVVGLVILELFIDCHFFFLIVLNKHYIVEFKFLVDYTTTLNVCLWSSG